MLVFLAAGIRALPGHRSNAIDSVTSIPQIASRQLLQARRFLRAPNVQ
jgi:hypothetical protein